MEEGPRPEHGFLRPNVLDEDIRDGLGSHLDSHRTQAVLHRDNALSSTQEKILRIMGPLWAKCGPTSMRPVSQVKRKPFK